MTIHISGLGYWLMVMSPHHPFARVGLMRDEATKCSGFYFLGLEVTW